MGSYESPVHLTTAHDITSFDCASGELADWLQRHALGSHRGGHTRVAVVTERDSSRVVGYYAIAPGGIRAADATSRMRVGGGRHPVPVVVLARLAVDVDHEGRGIGRSMLLDAVRRALAAAEQIGGRALVVACKDEAAKAFYLSRLPDFEELPGDPLHLALMLKDVRATLAAS